VTTSPGQPTGTGVTAETVSGDLVRFLEAKTRMAVRADADLFANGVVSSLFAMELVVHLESSYGIAVVGPDLVMDNFRTVPAMVALVLRLQQTPPVSSSV
jgi:methoxymalonate biosynthesis acyl carrier protein